MSRLRCNRALPPTCNSGSRVGTLEIEMFLYHALMRNRLSRKRSHRRSMIFQKSCFYYRIRRLVRLKHFIDRLFKTTQSYKLLMKMVGIHSSYRREYQEYVRRLISDRSFRIQRIVERFRANLKAKFELGRLKRIRLEDARHLEWKAHEKERDRRVHYKQIRQLKSRLQKIQERVFRCYDGLCNGRLFYSKERFELHQKMHQREKVTSYITEPKIRLKFSRTNG